MALLDPPARYQIDRRADAIAERLRETGALDELLTPAEAAKYLGKTVKSLAVWRHRGWGPNFVRTGTAPNSAVRYMRRHLVAWCESRTYASTSQYAQPTRNGRPLSRPRCITCGQ